jgi:hypothetical protein
VEEEKFDNFQQIEAENEEEDLLDSARKIQNYFSPPSKKAEIISPTTIKLENSVKTE